MVKEVFSVLKQDLATREKISTHGLITELMVFSVGEKCI